MSAPPETLWLIKLAILAALDEQRGLDGEIAGPIDYGHLSRVG